MVSLRRMKKTKAKSKQPSKPSKLKDILQRGIKENDELPANDTRKRETDINTPNRYKTRSKLVENDRAYQRNVLSKPPVEEIGEISQIKEIIFANEYLTDLDPVGAGLRSGMIDMMVSTSQQEAQAKEIFQRESVQMQLRTAVENRIMRTQVTEDKVIRELANLAFFDRGELYDEDGMLLPMNKIPKHARMCIAELEQKVTYTKDEDGNKIPKHSVIRARCYDKVPSLKLLLQHLGNPIPNNGKKGTVNYNQFNITQNASGNGPVQNNLDLSDFTDDELRVMHKMTGVGTDDNVLELENLERSINDNRQCTDSKNS